MKFKDKKAKKCFEGLGTSHCRAVKFWVSNNKNKMDCRLIFDPENLEGKWGNSIKGDAFGKLSCLTAGIVYGLIQMDSEKKIESGIMAGLSAMRRLKRTGHGEVNAGKPSFPYDAVAKEITEPTHSYQSAKVPSPPKKPGSPLKQWTIMEGLYQSDETQSSPFYGLAKRVALFGPRALSNIPYARFGKLIVGSAITRRSRREVQRPEIVMSHGLWIKHRRVPFP